MFIILPLGGSGERFRSSYVLPKALIPVNGKPILFHLIDNLTISNCIKFVFMPYNKEYVEYNLEETLKHRYPTINFKFLVLPTKTRGAAETVWVALNEINKQQIVDCPVLSIDCDNFYTTDIIDEWCGENKVYYFVDKTPNKLFSYIINDCNGYIVEIKEKEKISDFACCGAYGFESWKTLHTYINYIIDNNIIIKNEFYLSNVINEMMQKNVIFKSSNVKNKHYYSLGTPQQVKEYEYSFLFDLDGTLVSTDEIYTLVWNNIFKQYNFGFDVDEHFFNYFIKGKNDELFLSDLLPNVTKEQINEISTLKDDMFIELLKTSSKNILMPGVLNFFEQHKNKKMAIVTNCNKKSAEYILSHTGLDEYIPLLITATDCLKCKPDPEPYQKAIDQLSLDKTKTIIFEDSYSGYTSAKLSKVYKIILICNENSCNDILNTSDTKIMNYNDIDNVMLYHEHAKVNKTDDYSTDVYHELIKIYPVKDVVKNNSSLKTGYICDIQSYKIKHGLQNDMNIVLKINNANSDLSKTAEKMNLYGNEIHFYTNIRNNINNVIKTPACYGVVCLDKECDKKGIIMDDLNDNIGRFNVNLSNNTCDLLNIVNEIAKLHKTYYFINEDQVPLNMKSVNKIENVSYFKQLLDERVEKFFLRNEVLLTKREIDMLKTSYENYDKNVQYMSSFPLSFCHGDLKSANIFYQKHNTGYTPWFLDWQYIQLNKGVSDVVFMLVESVMFNEIKTDLVLNYYYFIIREFIGETYKYHDYIKDVKSALCIFPFVVCVWFNTEDIDKLLDKTFPLRFMKNLMKYYNYLLIK